MLNLSKSSRHHNDLKNNRIARDEADVQSLLKPCTPTQGEMQDRICLSTGMVASGDVANNWLLQVKPI